MVVRLHFNDDRHHKKRSKQVTIKQNLLPDMKDVNQGQLIHISRARMKLTTASTSGAGDDKSQDFESVVRDMN